MTYILSNLDFEYTWSRGRDFGGSPPKVVVDVSRRWQAILRLMAPGADILDVMAAHEGLGALEKGRRLLPWGWTPPVVEAARRGGLVVDAPPLEAVGEVNSKLFSHRLEQKMGWGPAGGRIIEKVEDLQAGVESIDGPWILKHPWGVSGREQRRGEGAVSAEVTRWVQRVLQWQEGLVLEPRLDVEAEFSVHFQIEEDGSICHVGQCRLITGARGTLRGLRPLEADEIPEEIMEGAKIAAEAVSDRGYVGAVGIDAMVGLWKGRRVLRPLVEINGRITFGRLALAMNNRLERSAPGESMTWIHPARSEEAGPLREPWPGKWQRGSFLLPEDVDPGGRSGTYVVFESQSSG